MRMQKNVVTVFAALLLAFGSAANWAEEPNIKNVDTPTDPARIDRDGKKICGYDLMNDSERAGYRNMMHQTKALADRDEIRVDHCARMRTRAKERGVPADE